MQVLTVALFQRPGAIGNSLLIKEIPQERKLLGGKIPGFLAIHRCRFFMLFTQSCTIDLSKNQFYCNWFEVPY